jgi:putative nucleotidyltransferase with HDIG domain
MSIISPQDLARRTGDLPPLPSAVSRLLEMSRDANVSLSQMAEVIRHEPALTTKVLRLCNSAYYGLPRKVTSLQEAVVYLGADTLVNFVLAGCVAAFYRAAHAGYGNLVGDLWRHSVSCAIASQLLADKCGEEKTGEAFTAGLLHDIGKIVLSAEVRARFDVIIERVRAENCTFEEAEREVLGFNHAEVGAIIAREWNLPVSLCEAIEFHHDPTRAEHFPRLCAQVHIANILCISLGIGLGNDGLAYAFHPKSLEATGLPISDLYPLTLRIHQQFAQAQALVGLMGD